MTDINATFVIIGGGIAGVSCTEHLAFLTTEPVFLITASPLIKAVTNLSRLTRTLEEFEVEERSAETLESSYPNVTVLHDVIEKLDSKNHVVETKSGKRVKYEKLCICSGAVPKLIAENHPYVIGIRDTDSVKEFSERISTARRIVIVGNGGIATEVVYETEGVQVIWVIKDKSISSTFVDPGAAEFFLSKLREEKTETVKITKRMKYVSSDVDKVSADVKGGALGPDWHLGVSLKGSRTEKTDLDIQYECEVKGLWTSEDIQKLGSAATAPNEGDWPVHVELSNGKVFGCDLIVSATGVTPNSNPFLQGNDVALSEDGAIKVDTNMETNIPDVFAAGDVCSPTWDPAPHWFQMRLWTQARQMGLYAARCMNGSLQGEKIILDFCFELFSHVTKFFGFKVVLLGLFNGQGLGRDYEILLRTTRGMEYIKVILKDHKMQGAILIGETNLEETFENLILNQMDLEVYGEDLLDPNIDIEDYFD